MLDFLCIGAQKAGTSWLHAQLSSHPAVAFPLGKEGHYWDWVQTGRRPDDIAWYQRRFADVAGRRLGDMTPAYAGLESRYVEQIQTHFPDVRILFLLRNPIERAWSAASMVAEFAQLADDECSDEWLLTILRSRDCIERGDYEKVLRRWRAVFAPEQVLPLFYDELGSDPLALLARVAGHLRIDPAPFAALPAARLRRRIRQGTGRRPSPVIRSLLFEQYRQKIESLAAYLGRDLSHWLRPESRATPSGS